MLSIEEIKNVSFRKASFGGYKPEDVDVFIDQVLITIEQLRKEKSDLVKKMDILATRVEEYRADEDAVHNALLSAQRVADNTIKEARAKAAYIVEESENMAKAKLYDLNVQIKQQKKQYTLLLAECNRVRDEIISNCNKHIIIAKELPSADKIKAMEVTIHQKYPTDTAKSYERAGEIASSEKQPVTVSDAPADANAITEETVETVAPVIADSSKATVNTAVSEDIFEEIDIVTDIDSNDHIVIDASSKKEKKKSKAFGVLKFGDDYDLNNDNDDDSAAASDDNT